MQRILILGGTRFLGRVFVEELLAQFPDQYDITLVHRGKTNTDLFPQLHHLHADRETPEGIRAIAKGEYDWVVDFSSYYPNSLREQLDAFNGKIGRYIYTSTVSVYDWSKADEGYISEAETPRLTCSKAERNEKSDALYGKLKAACEEELEDAHWLDKIIFRPSIVFGRYDYIDRHYYWLYRVQTQRQFVVPEEEATALNATFVEDYARLKIKALFAPTHRIHYNAATHAPASVRQLVETLMPLQGRLPRLITLSRALLEKEGVYMGRNGLPLVMGQPLRVSMDKVLQDFDIQFQSLESALAQTVEYYAPLGWKEGWYGWRSADEQQFINNFKL